MTPTLTVAIATHGPDWADRIRRMQLPRLEGVDYVVSWHKGLPDEPAEQQLRDDILAYRCTDDRSLSANRNNAFVHAKADVVLIADDDLTYHPDDLRAIAEAFRRHPDMDLLVTRFRSPYAWPMPAEAADLRLPLPKGFYVTAFMMAVRRRCLEGPTPLRFNINFGPGAPRFTASEDEMLLFTALRRGLRCRYEPLYCATHPGETTGTRPVADPGVLLTNGAMIALHHPCTWPLRIPVNALRIARRGRAPIGTALLRLFQGAIAISLNPKLAL